MGTWGNLWLCNQSLGKKPIGHMAFIFLKSHIKVMRGGFPDGSIHLIRLNQRPYVPRNENSRTKEHAS